MSYNTLRYEVAENILTLTLNRPEQLNAFTIEMAHELIDAFNRASDDDEVRAVVVTGAGRAFCAGMDLSQAGNVFGLNEKLQPTMQDMNERLDDPDIHRRRARHRRPRHPGDLRLQQAGDRRDQRRGGRHRRHHDLRHGYSPGLGARAHRLRVQQDRHHAGSLLQLVSAAHRRHRPGAGVGVQRGHPQARGGARGRFVKAVVPADQLLEEAYKIARRIAQFSPVAIALTRQMMYRCAAQPHPIEAHKVDSLAIYYTSRNSGKEGVRSFLEKRAPAFTQRTSTDMPPFYPWWEIDGCVHSWRSPLSLSRCCWIPSALASSCRWCRTLSWTFPATR